jgi:hypothetical protein
MILPHIFLFNCDLSRLKNPSHQLGGAVAPNQAPQGAACESCDKRAAN